jgi:hypothetical protein
MGAERATAAARVGRPRSLPLWAGVLVPPGAWAAQLFLSDLMIELACSPGNAGGDVFGADLRVWAVAGTALLAGAAIGSGLWAYSALRRLRPYPGETAWLDRARAFAWSGVASGGLYGALILFGLVGPLVLLPCEAPL